jgi:hypothetical protein
MTSQEILDFMLGKQSTATTTIAATSPSNRTPQKATSPRKSESQKKRELVAAAFAKTLNDWLETDDTLLQIIQSITNLRERIWETSKLLWKHRIEEEEETNNLIGNHGYRGSRSISLTVTDLELALDHGLVQHERMQSSMRKLLSSLSQTQDALGRRLDEYYKLTVGEEPLDENQYAILSRDECRALFAAAAKELFRKQSMAKELFDSCNNALLYSEGHPHDYGNKDPRHSSRLLSRRWSRTHKDSYMVEYSQLMQRIQS